MFVVEEIFISSCFSQLLLTIYLEENLIFSLETFVNNRKTKLYICPESANYFGNICQKKSNKRRIC